MYVPAHFEETDLSAINELMAAFPLAALVANSSAGLLANHLPLLPVGDSVLSGHIALGNDMHRLVSDGDEVLAIFKGHDAYISPNWYPTKKEHHKHVPTWNYEVAHVYGVITFLHDEKSKIAAVGRLTKHFEMLTNPDAPWKMSDAPKDYTQSLIENIVAFRIDISRVIAKSKLSQNREPRDFANVADMLDKRGEARLAGRMKSLRPSE